MARTRTFSEQRDDAYKLADLEGFTDRYPASEIGRYVNQGNAECWDLLVAARGFAYFGKPYWVMGDVDAGNGDNGVVMTVAGVPRVGIQTSYTLVVRIEDDDDIGSVPARFSTDGGATFTDQSFVTQVGAQNLPGTSLTISFTAGTPDADATFTSVAAKPSTVTGQRTYELPVDFYKLNQLYLTDGQNTVISLDPVDHVDKPYFDANGTPATGTPGYYQLRDGYFDIFPTPNYAYTINMSYVPSCQILIGDDDTFDGINGWEDYGSHWAARKMLLKEGDIEMANLVTQDLNKLAARISNMAAERDTGAAARVQDIRGALCWGRMKRPYYGRP
jgi:hypothetical protein